VEDRDGPGDHGDIGDCDIAWVVHLYRSRAQLQWCLPLLRNCYPTSRVVLINDGDDEGYKDIAAQHQCDYVPGEHLMALATGHLFLRRLLVELLRGPERYYFKIDPDTRIWRRFSRLPAAPSIFGTLETVSEGRQAPIAGPPNVQGGCIGMTRDVAEAMIESASLTEDTFHFRAFESWARCEDARRTVACGRFCEDFALSWLAHHLGFPILVNPEVLSQWRVPVGNTDLRFAVTHPHKVRPTEAQVLEILRRAKCFGRG
jgi:hypothetical protein